MSHIHIDRLNQNGVLEGWCQIPEYVSASGFKIIVSQNENIIAIGSPTFYRSDIDSLAKYDNAFNIRLFPTITSVDNSPIEFFESESGQIISSNYFTPDAQYIESSQNTNHSVAENRATLKSFELWKFLHPKFYNEFTFDDNSENIALLYYLCMPDLWKIKKEDWIDAVLIQFQTKTSIHSPYESIFKDTHLDFWPNCIFDPKYYSLNLDDDQGLTELSTAELLKKWISNFQGEQSIRPSSLVRRGYSDNNILVGSKVSKKKNIDGLRLISSGAGSFELLSSMIPIYDKDWLCAQALKSSINGSDILRDHLSYRKFNFPPNCFLHEDFQLKKYAHLCQKSDYGLSVSIFEVNSFVIEKIQVESDDVSKFNFDNPLNWLNEHFLPSAKLFDKNLIETITPGIFEYFSRVFPKQSIYQIFKNNIESLGYRACASAWDFSKLPKIVHLNQLRNLGQLRNNKKCKLSIIIPTLGRADLIFQFLNSLAQSLTQTSLEIIVSDDGSSINWDWLCYFFPNVILKKSDTNYGFLLNVNNATKDIKGDYLLIANNDVIVQPYAVDTLIEVFERNPHAAVLGGLILSEDGSVQENGGVLWKDATAWNLNRGISGDAWIARNTREVDYVSGCWMAVRSSVWTQLDGFSSEFAPAYCEDLDFCLKVQSINRGVYVVPHSKVIHLEGASMGRDIDSLVDGKRFQEINQKKIYNKWKKILSVSYSNNGDLSVTHRGIVNSKPLAIIFDHITPEPDKDAGSRTTFEFIEQILACGKYYVVFIPMNNIYNKYAQDLEKLGVEVIWGAGWDRFEKMCNAQSGSVELVIACRTAVAEKFMWQINRFANARKLLYTVDIEDYRHARAIGCNDNFQNEIMTDHLKRWGDLYKIFDKILVCSEDELHSMEHLFSNKLQLISPYMVKRLIHQKITDSFDLIFVGSASHPPNIRGVEWFLDEIFPDLIKAIPSICFHLVGSGFENYQNFNRDRVILHGTVSQRTLEYLYQLSDLSIAPLLSGAGVKGKVYEALNNGLPCLGTYVAFEGIGEVFNELPGDIAKTLIGLPDNFKERILDFYTNRVSFFEIDYYKCLLTILPKVKTHNIINLL